MRLNKYIAHSGISSRRKADELIEKGMVQVNGLPAETGYDVVEGDVVEVNGRIISLEKRLVYYMLNKPVGYITSAHDEQGRPTVMDLIDDIDERIYPIGRLDYNTSGLLLLTNDGDLAFKLTHPTSNIYKTYVAEVSGFLSMSEVERLEKGVNIGHHITAPAEVELLSQNSSSSVAQIRICEGKNRQVRKMFEAVGHKVITLDRIAVGNMKLGHLKSGQYKKLSQNEINYLKSL